MPRPRRSEHTRESLIEHGIELLSEHGYHGTGLKLILDTVKVPKGSFYNYFDSKEQFAAEIIEAYTATLMAQFERYLETSNDDPLTMIRKVYETMIKQFEAQGCHKGCLIGNMAAEIGGSSERCRTVMQETLEIWKRRIVELLELGQKKKQIRSDLGASELADVFWNTWEGGILRMKIDGNAASLRRSLDILLDYFLREPAG